MLKKVPKAKNYPEMGSKFLDMYILVVFKERKKSETAPKNLGELMWNHPQTNRPTYRPTKRRTTRLLELHRAAQKKVLESSLAKLFLIYICIFSSSSTTLGMISNFAPSLQLSLPYFINKLNNIELSPFICVTVCLRRKKTSSTIGTCKPAR